MSVVQTRGLIAKSLPNDKILDWPKLKEFADDKFKFDRYGRKFFKQRENAVGKGEIPFYQAIQTCNSPGIEDFWKHGRKWENGGDSIFSCSCNFSYPINEELQHFSHVEFIIWNWFQFGQG